eukprot:gene1650-17797_t
MNTTQFCIDKHDVVLHRQTPRTLPAHQYVLSRAGTVPLRTVSSRVLSDECPGFMINNAPDGNLTKGWVVAPGSARGPCGGPS